MTKTKERKRREHPLFDYSYEEEIIYECPVRGTVTQKVLVKRYKSEMQAAKEAIFGGGNELEELLDDGYEESETEE